MSCQTINGISSNQVVEVGLLKPRCATFTGNSLNDWIKWLAERECAVDWKNLDLTCITRTYTNVACEQDEAYVIQTLINGICQALECCENKLITLTSNRWTTPRVPKYHKQGTKIILTGAFNGATYTDVLTTLPEEARPKTQLIFPCAHDFPPSSSYNVFISINTLGEVSLLFTGAAPSNGTNRNIYLDGITFFTN